MTYTSGPCKFQSLLLRNICWLAASLLSVASLAAQTPLFGSIDAPDGSKGTTATAINGHSMIAGWYVDSGGLVHGFFRTNGGSITEFDPPGLTETFPTAINLSNQVVGYGARTSNHTTHEHGFLRSAQGRFAAIDVPGAADTLPYAINDNGQITGAYDDSAGVWHGFLREASGTYTVLDSPGAGTGPSQGTTAKAINFNGAVAGYYADTSGVNHGFVRDPQGNYSTFDAPGVAGSGTFPAAINSSGMITGTFSDASSLAHSFLRDSSGNVTSIDMPGATQTFAGAIDDSGVIVGEVTGGGFGAFRRDSAGNFGPLPMPVPNQGSDAISIAAGGRITGYFVDTGGLTHGFVERVQTQ